MKPAGRAPTRSVPVRRVGSLASSLPVRRGPHVLLVEDESPSARATATMLAGGGVFADVAVAKDADAALQCLRADAVDLLVLDMSLAEQTGLDLLGDVRASPDWRDLPVVVLSGQSDAEVVLRTYELGANCFVRKPRKVGEWAGAVRAIEQFWVRRTEPRDPARAGSVFQLPLGATATSVREARATIRRLLEGWGMAALAETAELCTSELATNAVVHAHSPVLLTAQRIATGVRIEVQDEVPGGVEAGSLDGVGETGRGLAIVDALSATWGVDQQDGGKTVWFELHDARPAG
jgi:CheY-like chemotaxis protein/anti-sigma regulatory factor (Ser/Thr protein kinase)